VAASGCARTVVVTDVKADNSVTRTVKFRASAPSDTGFSLGPKLEDVFSLPSGSPWKTQKVKEKDEDVYTAERTLRAGESLPQDVVIKGKQAPMGRLIVNEVSVREIAPGKLEYREVLRWQGERPKELMAPDPDMTNALKASLPKSLVDDATVRDISLSMQREMWRLLFGPGEPLLSQLLMHPDLAERHIKRRFGVVIDTVLQTKFGDRMAADERLSVTRKIITSAFNEPLQLRDKAKAKAEASPPGESKGNNPPVSMMFVARLPGKIVSTNGTLDEITGEVYWALYDQAAAIGDVVMTATCEVKK
jgi:hypothetical protein